jgi:predicted nucleic acid-binding Zn ribbon protein
VPFYYCDGCKDHWETQQRKKREWVNAQQRARRALNRWYLAQRPPGRCAVCGTAFNKGKRKDARYCSGACRQRANAKRLEKLRDQVEKLEGCLRRARELSESVWFGCYYDDD